MKANPSIPQVVPGRFSLIPRKHGIYYAHNKITGQRQTLKTRDKVRATEMLNAMNADDSDREHAEAMSEIYQRKAGRIVSKVTWAQAMEECAALAGKKESTRVRHREAFRGKDFNPLRSMTINQTHSDHFRLVAKCGKPSVNKYLRKLQNFAIEQGMMTTPILAPRVMRVEKKKETRAITREEYLRLLETEQNSERKLFYKMLWATGAAQFDGANLRAENFSRETGMLVYKRQKTGCECRLRFNGNIQTLLDVLPEEGFLFPRIQKQLTRDRSSEFHRRCRTKAVNIEGVTLHSFRYSMAERLAEAGFTIRQAQAALGHRSEAIAHAYAKHASIDCPALPSEEI